MKKIIVIEIAVLIICSVFTGLSFAKNRSFQAERSLKEKLAEQYMDELAQTDEEYDRLAEKLEEIRRKDDAKQLELWKRRLETLKEALD